METIKTPVQITQELLALVTTRKEILERHNSPDIKKNEDVLRSLTDELSLYGDGVSAMVDRTDPYFEAAAAQAHGGSQSLEELEQMFTDAVSHLHQQSDDLPDSLEKIFSELWD